MLKVPGLKIIRVYGDRREQADFPIPNKRQPLKNSTDDESQILNGDNELKAVSLHHVIRRSPCPFATELGEYERKFDEDRRKDLRSSDKEVEEYREVRLSNSVQDKAWLSGLRVLDSRSGGSRIKSSTLPLSRFVLGSPDFKASKHINNFVLSIGLIMWIGHHKEKFPNTWQYSAPP